MPQSLSAVYIHLVFSTMNFQDELRTLLRRHKVVWDERYIWD